MKWALAIGALALASACFEPVDDNPYRVDEPRVLAVRAEPAEALPGDPVSYEVLLAGTSSESVSLFFCTEPRRAEDRGAVSASCAEGASLQSIGASPLMLTNACALFGPNTPPTQGDQPPRRPADADPTGGYYVPVVAEFGGRLATAQHRVRCDLANVTRETFTAFEAGYRPNEHPRISELDLPPTVSAGEEIKISVRVEPDSTEAFIRYDQDRALLVDDREILRATFYMSDGEVGVGETQIREGRAEARWKAPAAASSADGWVVVRDSRGGVDWREFRVQVQD